MGRLKVIRTICAIGLLLTVGGIASGVSVESGGQASLGYTITPLPAGAADYQHTHAEAGFDIATGTPVSVVDDYSLPNSEAFAETSHSWGRATGDTAADLLGAANYASAGGSALQSWGYASTVHRVEFTLDAEQTIDIAYAFDAVTWVDSSSTAGSGFSVALAAIAIDGGLVYDSDPDWDDYVAVTGIGYEEKTLSDSGTISQLLAPGPHQVAFFLDTYENAIVPEPLTMLGVFGGVAGLTGYLRRRGRY